MYTLDANICIALLKGSRALVARLKAEHPRNIAVCSVVRAELYFGARKSARVQENLRVLDAFLKPLAEQTFNQAAAERYGILRAQLEAEGRPIGPNDMLIAAIACANDSVLVTRNVREFRRIPGLRIESWEPD